jgi:hypothetical protein
MDKGVTYIKVNRIDNEGNDNTLTLQGLTNIRIRYNDVGIVNYPVYTISEYPNYYLYQVFTTNTTSSTDNSSLDYNLNVSTGSISRGAAILFPGLFNISDINNDNLGGWNLNTYTFYNTPNTWVTLSFDSTDSSTTTYYFASPKFSAPTNLIGNFDSFDTNDLPYTYYIPPGIFQTGDEIKIYYGNLSSYTSNNSVFIITSSFNNIIDQVVLEPYITENFELSDCNVLYGNVDSYPFNSLYMDVDYSTNGMIAINTNQIISGSAFRSTVKPYYYSLRRHIRPRYNGSENTDPGAWEFFDVDAISGIGATPSQYILKGFRPSNFNVGDKIKIFQPGNTFKGEVSIYRITGNNISILQSQIPSLVTLSPLAGIVYLVDNYFENSTTFPLDTFNSDIFEYKYGNTTFPEIPNASALTMGNILEVADQNNVNVLQQGSQYFEAYNKIISDIFIPNTIISDIRQYGDGKQVTLNNLKVITSDFGTPTSPQNAGSATEYWIPTNNSAASVMATASGTTLSINTNQGAYEIE